VANPIGLGVGNGIKLLSGKW